MLLRVCLTAKSIAIWIVSTERLGVGPVTIACIGARTSDEGRGERKSFCSLALIAELVIQQNDICVTTLDPIERVFLGLVVPVVVGADEQTGPEGFFEVVIERFSFGGGRIVGEVENADLAHADFVIRDEREVKELTAKNAGRCAMSVQETNHGILLLLYEAVGNST